MQYCILLRYFNEPFVNPVIFLKQSLINFYTFVHFLCKGCHWFVKQTIKPFKNFFSFFVLFLSFIFCRNELVGLKWSNYLPKLGIKIVIANITLHYFAMAVIACYLRGGISIYFTQEKHFKPVTSIRVG